MLSLRVNQQMSRRVQGLGPLGRRNEAQDAGTRRVPNVGALMLRIGFWALYSTIIIIRNPKIV